MTQVARKISTNGIQVPRRLLNMAKLFSKNGTTTSKSRPMTIPRKAAAV